jgi:hypothetical protein
MLELEDPMHTNEKRPKPSVNPNPYWLVDSVSPNELCDSQ